MALRPFSLPVVGAPYANADGSNRQFEIKLCDRGDRLELRPEPKNRYDEHAIAVLSRNGVQIGYLASERAPYVGSLLRAGHDLVVLFQQATPWGAIARIGIDEVPALPAEARSAPPPSAEDEFYPPDPIWPDD